MSNKDTLFYRENKAVILDFNAEKISSDSGMLLLEKIERKHQIISHFSSFIIDERNQSYIKHSVDKLLKQRVLMLMQGYEDANDVNLLKDDPVFNEIFDNNLGSQPTISRFENSIDKHQIYKLLEAWLDRYISKLAGRKQVIIDIDGTDAETFGKSTTIIIQWFLRTYNV